MVEKNRNILQKSIASLPEYEPEPLVWLSIESELDAAEKQNALETAIRQLPVYQPPQSVWENIENDLARVPENDSKSAIVWLKRISAAAAAIAILVLGNHFFNQNAEQEHIAISFSTEVAEEALFRHDWDDDNDAFEMALSFCETENIVCQMPEFLVLKTELEDLNEARETLKSALDHYGADAELIAQLIQIEHDRSDVLKKMIEKI
jgi:hypothetical protein